MGSLWSKEPTMILAVVSAGLALGMGFGLHITPAQMGLVMAFAAAVLGLINRAQVTSPDTLQSLTPSTLAAAQDAAVPVRETIKKLPVVLLACALALGATGCATLRTGSVNVSLILNDARWGVMEACDVQWLQPADCTLAVDTLTLADGIAAQPIANVGPAVRQLLVDTEARLAADSRVRAYLDAVILLLAP